MSFGEIIYYLCHILFTYSTVLSVKEQHALFLTIQRLAPLMTDQERQVILSIKDFFPFVKY